MARKAIDPITPFWWTPDDQKDDPKPVRYKIRPLNGMQRIEVNTDLKIGPLGLIISATGVRNVLRHGLLDWENVEDTTGANVPFSENIDANLARLGEQELIAISNRILEASNVGADEKKD